MSGSEEWKRTVRRLSKLKRILGEAAGEEHHRIQTVLDMWAGGLGYELRYVGLPSGLRPDVLRGDASGTYLFLGDAKDSANETSRNAASVVRIFNYFTELAELVAEGVIKGGRLAVATNDPDEAKQWARTLEFLALVAELVDDQGAPLKFEVLPLDDETWVAYW